VPELPDVTVYVESLRARVIGAPLERVRIRSLFLLRSVDPAPAAFEGRTVEAVERLGKRIVLAFPGEHYLVFHLMITGRFRWRAPGAAVPKKFGLAAFDFPEGTLLLTEMGSKKRASLHCVHGAGALREHDPGGLDVFAADTGAFGAALRRENHTLKRALTDPRTFDGIGNAYSDEILWRARLSPLQWTTRLAPEEIARLHEAARATLREWTDRLRAETGERFPERVTAFREGMAVHGRYKKPCPACGAAVQRIVYAENETNYCAACQTKGKILADRSLSRLLREDWPRSIEELEQ
jgi:formamidopyrimidine-DNA glycosylase